MKAPLTEKLKRIKLIAIDLDGTLLSDGKELSEGNIKQIKRVREMGYLISFITGRMYGAARPFAEVLNLDSPLVCLNGTVIRHSRTGEIIHHNPIPKGLEDKVLEIAEAYPVHIFLYTMDEVYLRDVPTIIKEYLEKWAVNFRKVESFSTEKLPPLSQILIIGDRDILWSLKLEIEDSLDSRFSFFHYPSLRLPLWYLEIKNSGDSKGSGLRFLRKYFGLLKSEV
ncbi:MAG: HAD-IIB family hydrolase, partial [Fidelibacterota bacterium]